MLASVLRASLGKAGSPDEPRAEELVRHIESCRQQLRLIAQGLMPLAIVERGLCAALDDLSAQATAIHGVRCAATCEDDAQIDDPEVATHLYRIAQEAVTNASRHAKAKAIRIALRRAEGDTVLEIRDDGIGFDAVPRSGTGFRTMEYRAQAIGARLEFLSDGGSVVRLALPDAAAGDSHAG